MKLLFPLSILRKAWILSVIAFFIGFWTGIQAQPFQVSLINYFPKLAPFEKPLALIKAPGFESKLFVAEQRGAIYLLDDHSECSKRTLFIDLSGLVSQTGWETGLLGLAFHPGFAQNGRFFLSYTSGEGRDMVSYISEFQTDVPGSLKVKSNVPKVIMQVVQPYTNHNGGAILFGPDGYLYFSWGDGGSAGDPKNNSQNLATHLGKVMRIDVDRSANGKPYAIPADNPFAKRPGALPEIFAFGLRNVWQMAFDSKTGKLWAGDVGQNAFEEIDIIEPGKNYGWRGFEAESEFKKGEVTQYEKPVFFYSQKKDDKSITGGFVYHGPENKWQNLYWYGDYISGRIWCFDPATKSNFQVYQPKASSFHISCFGQNANKEILLASHEEGIIYKVTLPE